MVGQCLPWYAPPAPGIWAGSKPPPWAPPVSMWKAECAFTMADRPTSQLLMICKQQALMKTCRTHGTDLQLICQIQVLLKVNELNSFKSPSWYQPDIPSHLRPLLVHLHLCHLCLTQAAWRVLQAQFIGLGRDCLTMTLLPILSAVYGFHRENVPHLLKWHWRSSLCAEALGWFKSFCIVGCQPPSPFQPELSVRKEFGLRLGRSGEIWGDWSQVKMDIAWHCGAFVQYSEWMSKPVVAVHHGIRKKKKVLEV